MKVQLDPLRLKPLEKSYEVLETATEAVDRPRRNHVELAARHPCEEGVELGALRPSLRSADTLVDVLRGNAPPVPLAHHAKLK